ncbi:MAG: hypothetical protein MUE72_10695, partial [Chitinophagaceae bacterium]|nr:hypothetical protein [Chitinophagaceae bacterium]
TCNATVQVGNEYKVIENIEINQFTNLRNSVSFNSKSGLKKIYEPLWEKIDKFLMDNNVENRRVYIKMTDELTEKLNEKSDQGYPFLAIQNPNNGKYMVEQYDIITLH